MIENINKISFSKFLFVTLISHIIFALPTVITIILLNLISIKPFLLILLIMALISIPFSAAFTWLLAKGSNWENTLAAITVTCIYPGRFYAVILGFLLGIRIFNEVGGIILAILLFWGVKLISKSFGRFLIKAFVPEIAV